MMSTSRVFVRRPAGSRLRVVGFFALVLLAGWFVPPAAGQAPSDSGWVDLFNGKDLSGWETWLARAPGETKPLGLNNDPHKVFSVVDGAIFISGQVYGALTTTQEYENYHLRLEQKWGEKKWAPKLDKPRDSGICVHANGDHGLFAGAWKRSNQFQVGEGSLGDWWSIAGVAADFETERSGTDFRYTPGGAVISATRGRVLARDVVERPHGEWNVLEVIARGDSLTYRVNGRDVLRLGRNRQTVGGQETPLTRGQIQLQSEGAEVYYRHIQIRPLD